MEAGEGKPQTFPAIKHYCLSGFNALLRKGSDGSAGFGDFSPVVPRTDEFSLAFFGRVLRMCDSVRKEVVGTLDCSMRQLGKVWLQIRADLFMGFFSLSMKTEVTSNFFFHQCETRGTKLKLCFLLLFCFFFFVFCFHMPQPFISLSYSSQLYLQNAASSAHCLHLGLEEEKLKFCKMKRHIGNISRFVVCPVPPLPTPPDPTLCLPSKPVFD